jgi:hypothetical protein
MLSAKLEPAQIEATFRSMSVQEKAFVIASLEISAKCGCHDSQVLLSRLRDTY